MSGMSIWGRGLLGLWVKIYLLILFFGSGGRCCCVQAFSHCREEGLSSLQCPGYSLWRLLLL